MRRDSTNICQWHEVETGGELPVKGRDAPTVIQCAARRMGLSWRIARRLNPMATDICHRQAVLSEPAYEYALSYAGLPVRPKSAALSGIRRILDTRDFASFDAALACCSTLISLNFSFASTAGHIGYVMCGEVPLGRGATGNKTQGGDEWFPLCGWSGEHDHSGYVPHAELPGIRPTQRPHHLMQSLRRRPRDPPALPGQFGARVIANEHQRAPWSRSHGQRHAADDDR